MLNHSNTRIATRMFSQPTKKVIYMTSESNCWLTFLLNSIFKLGWINKSEALRKQKESDEQHQPSTEALEAASNSLCSGHRIVRCQHLCVINNLLSTSTKGIGVTRNINQS
ncbi:conserved hypothetical protein [Trichinella spiralis]|uniref:hypothetical protein n=1 Tax=Trichinella spiralis TaxID=6334 RepID=UPI0001EFC357|nr:conserved hypothetical protein [Trichinella spiralis]